MPLWKDLRAELAGLLDFILPPACPLCGAETPGLKTGRLCPRCLAGITPLASPHCPRCALPYPAETGSDHLCEGCLREAPPFAAVAAAGIYTGALRDAVHRFKYQDAVHLDLPLSLLLREAVERMLPAFSPDLIVPVPLHPEKIRKRTYNQALLIARRLGKKRISVPAALLIRTRPTPPQQGLAARQRRRNLQGAFALGASVKGKRILLVDDVLTTGATARECAGVLLDGGAEEVAVAVLARAARHLP